MKSLNKSKCLINWSTDWQIIHGDLSDNTLAVYDEQASQAVAQIFQVDAVVLWDLMRQIWQQWDIDVTKTTFVAWSISPGQMGERTVDWNAQNLGAQCMEFGGTIAEGNDFSWTNKREVQWVE